MKALREEQVAQAISYMSSMGAAKLFRDAVLQSPEFLRRFWAEAWEYPELATVMKRLEDNGSMPYYVTRERFSFGECYSILTVSPYEEDFAIGAPQHLEDAGVYRVYAYVWNVTDDSKSKPGAVLVQNRGGALCRVL